MVVFNIADTMTGKRLKKYFRFDSAVGIGLEPDIKNNVSTTLNCLMKCIFRIVRGARCVTTKWRVY